MGVNRHNAKRALARVASPRFALHLAAYRLSSNRSVIDADVARWAAVRHLSTRGGMEDLLYLLTWAPEFRSLFYVRIGLVRVLLQPLAKGEPTLHINMHSADIGPGLYIQHGFSTVLAARSIGARCWVNQQVTVGYTDEVSTPVIGDDVRIGAGAMVLGDVHVGDGAQIGANSVAIRDVPPGHVVVSQPSRVLAPRDERLAGAR